MNALYQATIPLFVKHLTALDAILTKAEAHVAAQGLNEAELLDRRLAPDMFPLKKQIQIACDNAKGASARLAGQDVPSFPDDEQTIADLHTRIQKTITFVRTISEASFEGAAERQVRLPYFAKQYMTGFGYAYEYAVPNFLFHVVVAYGLLRQAGVAIGKADYIGSLPLINES